MICAPKPYYVLLITPESLSICFRGDSGHKFCIMDVPRRPPPDIRFVQRQPRRRAEISVVRIGQRRQALPGYPLPAVPQARHKESPGDAHDGGSSGYVEYQDEDYYTPTGNGEQVNSFYIL